MRWEALVFTPAAFVRHGTPVHPSDFDAPGRGRSLRGHRVSKALLPKTELLDLLDALSQRLCRRRTVARLYVIGGVCMALAHDRDQFTEDVGVRIDAGHEALVKAGERGRR